MAKARPLIAVVDDEEDILKTVKAIFKSLYDVVAFADPLEALKKIPSLNPELILLDIKMPGMDGISLLKELKRLDPDIEVVMVTAMADSRSAVASMQAGAYDYINKPFDAEEMKLVIEKAIEKKRLEKENRALRQMTRESFGEMIGQSDAMRDVFDLIERVAASDSTVLITGETGSGKEMVAKAVHKRSGRHDRPFIAVNCAAIPENLFESELFGYERGAFTGALERHAGIFEIADQGTVFLDEIGCLPYQMQAKLLRVIQEGEVNRIGGSGPVPVDIRLICATNADLKELAKKGSFRQDLYYRLNVIPVKVPPLRSRTEDIPLLLSHFLSKFNKKMNRNIRGFNDSAVRLLSGYMWPGNVRELENVVERIVVLAQKDFVEIEDLPKGIFDECDLPDDAELLKFLDDSEKDHIAKTLIRTGGNHSRAARALKIDRTTLLSKLRKHNIN